MIERAIGKINRIKIHEYGADNGFHLLDFMKSYYAKVPVGRQGHCNRLWQGTCCIINQHYLVLSVLNQLHSSIFSSSFITLRKRPSASRVRDLTVPSGKPRSSAIAAGDLSS